MKRISTHNSKNHQLWQQLRKGDKYAFTEIYQKNAPFLAAYGYKLTLNKEIVNDAIQDVFINLWQKRTQLPTVKNIKAYLLKSLRNRILRILETRNLNGNGEQPHQAIQDSYEHHLIQEELTEENLSKLYLGIQSLPTRQKEVINLRYYQNLTIEEIAGVLNINYQSVSNLLYRGIKTLKQQIHTRSLPNQN